ncbi:DNA mismatch repair protein MutT [Bacillus sp. FJAT-22090]|uniref:DUF4083 family protein n=1 Tax=Bacillus sp. FJAT-22090 TaxID=1581038 RepID=UPI0006AE4EDF|nr:DUF4083 family protein [Bacillus sp. FJAT-22090]ALC85095.1 DNA mismatch repair protein MutT [Bacillus sp. FJAT-22090]
MNVIFALIPIFLILLGVISFSLLIRRLIINSSLRNIHSKEIETKLDKIIYLLEKDRSNS